MIFSVLQQSLVYLVICLVMYLKVAWAVKSFIFVFKYLMRTDPVSKYNFIPDASVLYLVNKYTLLHDV